MDHTQRPPVLYVGIYNRVIVQCESVIVPYKQEAKKKKSSINDVGEVDASHRKRIEKQQNLQRDRRNREVSALKAVWLQIAGRFVWCRNREEYRLQ